MKTRLVPPVRALAPWFGSLALVGCFSEPTALDPDGASSDADTTGSPTDDGSTDDADATGPATSFDGSAGDGATSPSDGDETGDESGPGCATEYEPLGTHIWIANSPAGTISKIETASGQEVARYATGPASQAEPSRISVNLLGDVAVSNRGEVSGGAGGVTKIAGSLAHCIDRNRNGRIDTSSGPDDVLPWGDDECVLWNLEIPSDSYARGPRPTAWEGALDGDGCPAVDPRLWVGWYDFAGNAARFHRLDGNEGVILDSVDEPWNELEYGPYGGAVDLRGDLWALGWQLGPLVRVDAETLEVERIEVPAPPQGQLWTYGMSLDAEGNPWISSASSVGKYDVADGEWEWIGTQHQGSRGMAVDREQRAWLAVDQTSAFGCALLAIDVTDNSIIAPEIAIPGCTTPVGVSIDVEGYVWVVDHVADTAFKIDPESYALEDVVEGLTAPYTYSDMTGVGLEVAMARD